ncbi:mucin-2-like [Eurosta solidaginis]|uniref:mucin-2-like n=1 Tax=Eurosta solidaginis TaxID=178769 RepID=UPI00353075C6
MTTFAKDIIEINLSTDELMLNELERRDGIYSFIFHELEVPKVDTPTTSIPKSKLINSNYTTTTTNTFTTTTTFTTEDKSNASIDNNTNSNVYNNQDNDSFPDALKIKTESRLMQHITTNTTAITTITVATTTTTLTFTSPVTTSFINTFPSATCAAVTATTIIVPSLFTTSPLPTSTQSTLGGNTCLPSFSGMSMRSYHDYLKTWHPPPSLVYDNPKLYAYMANCGFRVRVPTPRFSHITTPLVRNRRHALKETPEYKGMYDSTCMCAPVPDLRDLFPHDPDVHAPFEMTMEVATTTVLEENEIGSLEYDDDCCGDVVLMAGAPVLQ